jgi:hypothetical protein
LGPLQRGANAGEGSEVCHRLDTRVEHALEETPVPDVAGDHLESISPSSPTHGSDVVLLAGRGVVRIEVVEPDDVVAPREKERADVASDESGCACDQDARSQARPSRVG